jgi:hypothetical protein
MIQAFATMSFRALPRVTRACAGLVKAKKPLLV